MVNKFFRKANSLILAAAMTVTMIPAPVTLAAGTADTAQPGIVQQADEVDMEVSVRTVGAINGRTYTVIEGNIPTLPSKVKLDDGTVAQIQWTDWDLSLSEGTHPLTGTAGETQISVNVKVLPCDEVVEDVQAMGRSDDTYDEKREAIHPLKGYKGKFVAEYDIVPNDVKYIHDRAVIYLPATDNTGERFSSESAWDYGARLQFKHGYSDLYYFQTQIGDGQDKDNAVYYPTNGEIDAAVNNNQPNALSYDEKSIYHVRTEMDTATDTTKGNVKIFITDPEGIEHEVTQPGGNAFRIYPTDGIVKNFAAMRGGYRLINHKVSWESGYATKKTEIYLKGEDGTYVKEDEAVLTKELPGYISKNVDAKIVRNNKSYKLDETEDSGWYKDGQKVEIVSADEGQEVTYRAYYSYENTVSKTDLEEKIQAAQSVKDKQEDYTVASWKTFKDALIRANYANTSKTVSQEEVTNAAQALTTAQAQLISIKDLKIAVKALQDDVDGKETQKNDYANWNTVVSRLNSAKEVLENANATKDEVNTAKRNLDGLRLITKAEQELTDAKKALERSVALAEQKLPQEAEYTPASWQIFKDALDACKDLPETTTKDEYVAKKGTLESAMEGLTKLADKTALKQAISAAEAKAEKKADYDAVSYGKMEEKLIAAKKVDANANATKTEVETATTELQDAVTSLKPAEVKVNSITPNKKSYTVAAGKTLDLKKVFTVGPSNATNKGLTYSIDKKYKAYASIKSGSSVATTKKGAGKTIEVKATAADGSGKTATIKIKIVKVAVTKVTIKGSKSVKAGKKVTLKATIKPKDATNTSVTWSIAKKYKKYASVSKKGVVTTKKAGKGKTIKVTATSKDNKKKKATFSIKIK